MGTAPAEIGISGKTDESGDPGGCSRVPRVPAVLRDTPKLIANFARLADAFRRAKSVPVLTRQFFGDQPPAAQMLEKMVHPTGFEPVTPAFEGQDLRSTWDVTEHKKSAFSI
jgi:hypothetical protein